MKFQAGLESGSTILPSGRAGDNRAIEQTFRENPEIAETVQDEYYRQWDIARQETFVETFSISEADQEFFRKCPQALAFMSRHAFDRRFLPEFWQPGELREDIKAAESTKVFSQDYLNPHLVHKPTVFAATMRPFLTRSGYAPVLHLDIGQLFAANRVGTVKPQDAGNFLLLHAVTHLQKLYPEGKIVQDGGDEFSVWLDAENSKKVELGEDEVELQERLSRSFSAQQGLFQAGDDTLVRPLQVQVNRSAPGDGDGVSASERLLPQSDEDLEQAFERIKQRHPEMSDICTSLAQRRDAEGRAKTVQMLSMMLEDPLLGEVSEQRSENAVVVADAL